MPTVVETQRRHSGLSNAYVAPKRRSRRAGRGLLSLDLKADFHGDLEFLHLVFRDAAALFDDLEPKHVTDGMCRLGDRSSYGFGKTDGRGADDLGDLVCSRHGALLESIVGHLMR